MRGRKVVPISEYRKLPTLKLDSGKSSEGRIAALIDKAKQIIARGKETKPL